MVDATALQRMVVVLLIALCVATSWAATPGSISLSGIIRDQAPDTMCGKNGAGGSCGHANDGNGFAGTDFQWTNAQDPGIAGPVCNNANGWKPPSCGALDADQTPIYAFKGLSPKQTVHSPASFKNWFHDSNQTIKLTTNITLSLTDKGYYYQNLSFFPLDGIGWNDYAYDSKKKSHNYAYCVEFHSRFGYAGGEVFNFTGDDDVFVYLDNRLMLDLGGVHSSLSGIIKLDTIPDFVVGTNYRFDMFYCERHTEASTIGLTTSLQFYCSYYDWCGVCEGNGQSCCTPGNITKYCNDNNPCTIDTCGINNPASATPTSCTHTPISCPAATKCQVATCTGTSCALSNITCNDNNPCTVDTCDPAIGCQYKAKVCDDSSKCTTDTCDAVTGQCNFAPISCDDKLGCTVDSCAPATGCAHVPVVCNDNSKCTTDTCNEPSGTCNYAPIICNDGSLCTSDSCNATSGCSFINVNCVPASPSKCLIYGCTPSSGCTSTNVVCDDKNACTADTCDPNSGCIFTNTCDDLNACTIDTCVPASGCVHKNVSCNDNNLCTNDICDAISGCAHPAVSCDDADPCTIDTCSPTTGCAHQKIDPAVCVACGNINCTTTNACNPNTCGATGSCVLTNITCDDSNLCTNDVCSNTADKAHGTPYTCSNTPVSCSSSDPCKIASCDAKTGTCILTNKVCDDGNLCTDDTCVAGVCKFVDKSCDSTFCNPQVCNSTTGLCTANPVICNDNNKCTTDTCSDSEARCKFDAVVCPTNDPCNNYQCNAATGTCAITSVVCDDSNPCTNDTCQNIGGKPSCSFTNFECTTDPCNPKKCNVGDGQCYPNPLKCDDGSQCTTDTAVCTNGVLSCNYTANTLCDDKNVCTNDICSATGDACSHTNITCLSQGACFIQDCDNVTGCTYTPRVCPPVSGNLCFENKCDSVAGCQIQQKVCVVDDVNCFEGTCDPKTGGCTKTKRGDFGTATSSNGIACVLRYDTAAKAAVIGAGAAVGIAIGAAAAVGILGYGGKKGYDFYQAHYGIKDTSVQNNPLYEQSEGHRDNPLFEQRA